MRTVITTTDVYELLELEDMGNDVLRTAVQNVEDIYGQKELDQLTEENKGLFEWVCLNILGIRVKDDSRGKLSLVSRVMDGKTISERISNDFCNEFLGERKFSCELEGFFGQAIQHTDTLCKLLRLAGTIGAYSCDNLSLEADGGNLAFGFSDNGKNVHANLLKEMQKSAMMIRSDLRVSLDRAFHDMSEALEADIMFVGTEAWAAQQCIDHNIEFDDEGNIVEL